MQLQPTAPDFPTNFATRALGSADTGADRGAGFAALLRQSQTSAPAAPPPAPPAPVAPPAPQPAVPPPPVAHAATPKTATPTDAQDPPAGPLGDADAAAGTPPEPAAADAAPATPADLARTLLRAKLRTADGGAAAKATKGTQPEIADEDKLVVTGRSKLATTSPVQTEALATPLPGVQPEVNPLPRPDADAAQADPPADTAKAAAPSLADALAARHDVAPKDAATAAPVTAHAPPAGASFAALLSEQGTDAATGAPSRSAAIDAAAPAAPPSGAFGTAPAAGTTATTPIDLPTPVASPDFAQHLGVQVSVLAKDGVQQAELHLNPADMGPVSVQITLDGTQARIDFGADVAATRHAIEAGLPQLAGALADAGFTLAGGGVSQHAGSGGGSGSGHGTADGQRGGTGRTAAADGDTGTAARSVARRSVRVGGLDLYA